jgi:hypothetical protein
VAARRERTERSDLPLSRANRVTLERLQHAELVAIRIRHDHPCGVGLLTNIDPAGTQSLEPGDLRELILWAYIKMKTVLDHPVVHDLDKQDVWHDAVLGAAFWRLENHLDHIVMGSAPAEDVPPK